MPNRKDQDGLYRRGDSPYWWASYTDASGARTRRSTQTADRREAEGLLAKWKLAAYQERHWDAPPSHTFDELMLNYLADTQATKRSAERDRRCAAWLYPHFTGKELTTLAVGDLYHYQRARRADGVKEPTIRRELSLLSAALNHARQNWGWAVTNPVQGHLPASSEGRVRWIRPEQARALIAAAASEPRSPHAADFIRLALHTGCRKTELLGLEWARVDWQANLLYLEMQHTKTRKRRAVPLNHEARAALLNRARFRAEHCPASPWVFCDRDGQRIANVRRAFETACRRIGLADFRIHDLRHTCAAWLVSAGVALAEVRDLLGHASITMTERYAHLAPENVRAAVAVLDGVSRSGHASPMEGGQKTA
jgi:integrase